MVRIVAVPDDITLHLAYDLLEGAPHSGYAPRGELLEVRRLRLVDDRTVGEGAVALEEVAHEAHCSALDFLLHLRLTGIHGRPFLVRLLGTIPSSPRKSYLYNS